MDYISLPFSFDQISELLEFCPSDDHNIQHKNNIPPMIQVPISPITNDDKPSKDKNKLKSSPSCSLKNLKDVGDIKKIMHRDVERRRRQEMTSLYRALRSELPIECLKGKRSAADHIHETVGYIKIMQEKLEKLNEKKDKLMRPHLIKNPGSSMLSTISSKKCSKSSCDNETSVEVKNTMSGIEIIISTDVSGGITLSGVLNIVSEEEGLSLINCISTRVHSRMLHTLDIQVNKGQNARAVELQGKIMDFCNRNMSK
ncbi:basic helix-loop-helix transcription factor [Lithospermum erythrorhizon]|uniref:Basic helix-loop-helix transcription factor n=1 Tax=Lithospermum erythrorhizon TaxID=34254 RepID=A0AAV3S1U7_LITER